ncbi:MAG TPA: hypothetical protein VIL36_16920 [Acidimicrobiales bacterium]
MSAPALAAEARTATGGDKADEGDEANEAGALGEAQEATDDGGGAAGASPPVHRLRDLDRTGRWVAALLAAALLLAPLLAAAHFLPDWVPATDNAFIALRAYDAGTERTPLTGQPSFSRYYGGDDEAHVDHLGPWAFYGLAPFVRALGPTAGMLTFTVLVSGAVSLLVPWVVFRRLGPRVAVVAAVATSLVVFTRGAASLVNPLSSVFSGYPAFLAAVLVWALLAGDDRLLPLAAGVLSFAVQMHLAVGPLSLVLGVALAAGVATNWWCSGGLTRPRRRALLGAGVVGGVLWLPVVVQQLFGRYPNLSALLEFGGDTDRDAQGTATAVDHLVHVFGWPPLLGRTDFRPFTDLYPEPRPLTWVTAGLVVAVVTVAGVRWARRPGGAPRALLAVLVGVLALAGYVSSSNTPTSAEAFRGEFYHWVWPLTFCTALVLALVVVEAVRAVASGRVLPGVAGRAGRWRDRLPARPWVGVVAAGAAVAVVAALPVVGLAVDRPANTLYAMQSEVRREAYESLADGIAAHRDELTGPVLLTTKGQLSIGLHHSALAAQLEARGIPVVLPADNLNYVADQRLADRGTVEAVLVLVVDSFVWHPAPSELDLPGEEIARYDVGDRPAAAAAYDALVAQLEGADRIELDDELLERSATAARGLGGLTPEALRDHARQALIDVPTLALLREHPPAAPRLDTDALATLHDALAAAAEDAVVTPSTTTSLRVLLITDPDEVDAFLGR